MTDRDALARELCEQRYPATVAVHADFFDQLEPVSQERWREMADIAMLHIEAARAEERELVNLDAARFRFLKTVTDTEPLSADDWVMIASDEVTDVPAPAAPVVWTDEQLVAAIAAWFNNHTFLRSPTYALTNYGEQMRAALEAAGRGK